MAAEHPDGDAWFDDDAGPVVRPYALTGGRTRTVGADLDLVALLTATARGRTLSHRLDPERQAIVDLCGERMSVAEISAYLDLPLGVVRVLVGDMIDQGLLVVQRPAASRQVAPDVALLETVIHGLRNVT